MNIVFATNVTGLINMTQAVLPSFLKRPEGGRGDIINIGSVAGILQLHLFTYHNRHANKSRNVLFPRFRSRVLSWRLNLLRHQGCYPQFHPEPEERANCHQDQGYRD